MIHDNAFLILNAIFETARHMEHVNIPISTNRDSILRLVNAVLLEQFDKITRHYTFMTPDVKEFCYNQLITNISQEDIDDTLSDNQQEVEMMLNNDILACSDMLFATSRPTNIPDDSDPFLKEPYLKWYHIKGGSQKLGYVVIDPKTMGFIIIKTSNRFNAELRNNLATNLKYILYFCEKLTDLLLTNEVNVTIIVNNIMEKIMVNNNG